MRLVRFEPELQAVRTALQVEAFRDLPLGFFCTAVGKSGVAELEGFRRVEDNRRQVGIEEPRRG